MSPRAVVRVESVDVSTVLGSMRTARTHATTVLSNLAKSVQLKTSKYDSKTEKVAQAIALRTTGLCLRQIERKKALR